MTNAPSERSDGAFVAFRCTGVGPDWEPTAFAAYIRPVRQREEHCQCVAEFSFLPH